MDHRDIAWASSIGDRLEGLSAVLDAVRHERARSRSQVERTTGLTRAVVAQRIGELVELGVLSERGTHASTGGRPARQLTFEADVGRILVADLGATSIDVAIADVGGEVLDRRSEIADIAAGPEPTFARVEALFAELLATEHADRPLWGVGIGVPGPVEFTTGRPVSPPIMPGWDGYPIRERFATRYSAPVWVDNDVNIMALGEWRAGVARGHQNVVFVKIGTGVGAGLISDGMLHRGAQGSAGDVGHIQVVEDRDVLCRCGNVGCLEALAGGHALAREAEVAARDGRSPLLAQALEAVGHVSAVDVALAAARGDGYCAELLQRSGRLVGGMLASVVNFFNPSLIVIGGGVAQAGDRVLAAIRETVYRRSLPLATRDLLVVRSSLGDGAGIIGGAAMVADELFSPVNLPATVERHLGQVLASAARARTSAPKAEEALLTSL